MNISHYIQELLFTKQKVVLPEIGTFELVSKPAHIDGATGTITPPSKTIKFSYNEGANYSVLVKHISRRQGVSTAKALEIVCNFGKEISNRLHNGEEVELEGVGVLRVIGAGTIIFLPFSSYSNLGESFGLPTISIAGNKQLTNEQPDSNEDATAESAESHNAIEEEPFELIDDIAEEPNEVTAEPKIPEAPSFNPEPAIVQEASIPEVKEEPVKVEVIADEVKAAPTITPPPFIPTSQASADDIPVPNIKIQSVGVPDEEIVVKKGKNGWIWTFLVIICVLAISFVALYHYNPKIFSFIIPDNDETVTAPKVPSDADSTYYQTLTGAVKDTISANDSVSVDSARANLQAIDSAAKKNAVKKVIKAPSEIAKRPMTKDEMEMLINEKLNLGNRNAATKASDTPQKASTSPKIASDRVMAQTNSSASGDKRYNVIAASVPSAAEAQKMAELLKSKGFTPQIMEPIKGRIRISIGSYSSTREAVNAANSAKRKLGTDVWILNPSK